MLRIDKLPPQIRSYRHLEGKELILHLKGLDLDKPRIVGVVQSGTVVQAEYEGVIYYSVLDNFALYYWLNSWAKKPDKTVSSVAEARFMNADWTPVRAIGK